MGTTANGIVYPDSSSPVGSVRSHLQQLAETADAALGGAWSAYALAWTATTTNPTIGNGTVVSRYSKVGKTIVVNVRITMGSTTTYGSGNWQISLPVAPFLAPPRLQVFAFDVSTGAPYRGVVHTGAGSTVALAASAATANDVQLTSAAPFAWAVGDILEVYGTYESV